MVSFKNLGLSNTNKMFEVALERKFAIPGYNFSNLEQLQAIIIGCGETKSPVILQNSPSAGKYASPVMVRYMVQGAVEMAKELGYDIPIALHLDHGNSFELAKNCIDNGFSSVMFDGSHLKYDENVSTTKKIVQCAHGKDVSVEAELGVIAGIEDHIKSNKHYYTDPEQVEDFVTKTNCDSLAIAIGTSHGAYKFKVDKESDIPELRFDILQEVRERLGKFPIVLHGSSSIPKNYVDIINKYGGKVAKAFGIPEIQLRKATQYGICKINIATDFRIIFTAMIRKYLGENPDHIGPRQYLGLARQESIEMIKHRNTEVLGSANQAQYI
ncbi:MAG: ketose-bisphosphate aldolase [Promethearchaeota archaeon]|nr:MAG: ketose-bisphosphate aldolase [Candidatus Lokiarchaeota archaeon]